MNYDDLVNLDPKAFTEEARNWKRAADGIRDRGNDLEQTLKKLDGWTGTAADAAKPKFTGHRKRYADAAAVMAQIPAVLDDAARRLGDVHERAWQLTREAHTPTPGFSNQTAPWSPKGKVSARYRWPTSTRTPPGCKMPSEL
jgi:uncharacterized protein YukE